MEGIPLARELVNNLFYSQYEQFRAFLLALAEKHGSLAVEVLLSVLKIGGRLGGALWSHSIPSASHLSWLCLADLSSLLEQSTGTERQHRWTEVVEMSSAFESLLYLEEIRRSLKFNNSLGMHCTEDCPHYCDSSDEMEHPPSSDLELDRVDDGSCRSYRGKCQHPCFTANEQVVAVGSRRGSLYGDDFREKMHGAAHKSQEFDCPLVEDLNVEIILALRNIWHREYPELDLISKDLEVFHQDDLHLERKKQVLYADGSGIAEPIRQQDMGLSDDFANDRSGRCTATVKELTLAFPDLLSAFCKASEKYSVSIQTVLPSEEGCFGEPSIRKPQVSGSFESWSDDSHSLKGVARIQLCVHSLVQKEVQTVHLQEIRQSAQMRQLMKAARHLRYLNDSVSLDSDYRDVVKILFQEAALAVNGDECLLFDGISRSLDVMLLSELLGSGRTALCVAAEETRMQDETAMCGDRNERAIPPVFKRLHKHLQVHMPNDASGITCGIGAWVAGYKSELFQYALTPVAHIFNGIVNVTLSLIEGSLFNLAADVLSPFPHLCPLLVVMGWDLLSQNTSPRQKMLDTLWASKQGAVSVKSQSEGSSFVGYICEMLGYQLEIARFLASSPVHRKPATTKRTEPWCTSGIIAPSSERESSDSGNPFLANLVLEHLGSHSPMRVLFQFLPDINAEDALHFLTRQPMGSLGNSRSAVCFAGHEWILSTRLTRTVFEGDWLPMMRGSDVELLQMYAGIGAATAALYICKWDFATTSISPTEKQTDFFLAKFQQNLELVCTPSRRLWMLDVILSLLHLEILEMDYSILHGKCGLSCATTVNELATIYAENNASRFVSLVGELVVVVSRCIPTEYHRMSNISRDEGDRCLSIRVHKASQIARLVNAWEWRLKGLQHLCDSQLQWQRRALKMFHAAAPTLVNVYLQHGQYDLVTEAMDRFDLPEEEVASLLLSEWMKKVEDHVYGEGEANSSLGTALEAIMGWAPFAAISGAILCLDFAIASSKSVQSSKPLVNHALRMLMESDEKELGPDKSFIASSMKHLLDKIEEFVEQGQIQSIQAVFMPPDLGSDLRQGPKPRAMLLLQQVIVDASCGKRQFLSGKLHNIVKALADDEVDDPGMRPEWPFTHRRCGQIFESEGGFSLGFAPIVGSSVHGYVGAGGSYQAGEIVLCPLKKRGRRWLTFLGNKPAVFVSAFTLYIATIGDVVDGVDTTHDFNFFSLIHESPKDLLARIVFEQISLDAALKVAEVMDVELVQHVISVCVHPVYPPSAGRGWASISEAITSATVTGEKAGSTLRLWFDVIKHLMTVSPARAILVCIFGNRRSWLENSGDLLQDQGHMLLEFTLEESDHYPILRRWIQMQWNIQELSHFPSVQKSEKAGVVKKSLKRPHSQHQEVCTTGESHCMVRRSDDTRRIKERLDADTNERRKEVCKAFLVVEPCQSNNGQSYGICKLSFDWESQRPCEVAAWRLVGEGKLVDAQLLADRWLCGGASDSLLRLLVERQEDSSGQANDWQPQPNSSVNSWQYCIRLRNKNLAARLALRYHNCWELGAAIDVLTMCQCHLRPSDPQFREVSDRKISLLQFSRIMQADCEFVRWQEVELLCESDPEGLALRLSGKGAVLEALEVVETYRLPAELEIELKGRQLVQIFGTGPADGGGPAAGLKFLLAHSENAFPIAMAALEQLPNLHSKQLLVQFISKHHTGRLSNEDRQQVDAMVFGLSILKALPVPWQHRCSALYKYPKLIYETLLMWKQWHTALELLQAFPVLEDDALIIAYAAKAINTSMSSNAEQWVSMFTKSRNFTAHATSSRPHFNSFSSNSKGEPSLSVLCTSIEIDAPMSQDNYIGKQKCGGTLPPSHRAAWEAMAGPAEEHVLNMVPEGYERIAPVSLAEDWVLTGDPSRDDAVRNSHRFESAPCPILFKSLLLLCSHDTVAAAAAVDVCITQAKCVLGEEHLTFISSLESIERAFYAAGAFATILQTAVGQLQNLVGAERGGLFCHVETREPTSPSSLKDFVWTPDNLIDLLQYARSWIGRIEVLQSLLESGVPASLEDILDEVSAIQLRDRLITKERYNMAIITCAKCKVDAFPVWMAWGHALLRIGGYARAREKLKQALQLHRSDPASTVWDIIFTIEGGPPADVAAANELYVHMVKNVYCSTDDSLSADSYLNVLHVPSFGKSDKARWSCEDSPDVLAGYLLSSKGDDHVVRSHLDDAHFEECLFYLQGFCQKDALEFLFQHGRYTQACQVVLPVNGMFALPLASSQQLQSPSSSPQRPDWLTTDYGSLDDLCDLFVGYAAIPVLEHVLAASLALSRNQDLGSFMHSTACVQRICNYCEVHRHFNHLYRFQLLKKDHVAAGLCQIQLFHIALAQDEAIRHLEQAKVHFDEGLLVRQHAGEGVKNIGKMTRIRSPSEKLTEEELIKFTARVSLQVDVARSFSDTEGCPWKYSLFGNPHDADTQKRRCEVVEILLDRNFDLAFKIIYEYNLPRTQIYAGFAASLAAKKKNHQITDFFRNIKGTIGDDDLDQILGAAISVYANKHRERPDRLIEMIGSSHRKVLALVISGRLKTALQVASRAGSVADVQFVAHQAQLTQASGVIDSCKQWLAQNQVRT